MVLNHVVFFLEGGALIYTEGKNGLTDAKFWFGIDRAKFSEAMGFEAANGNKLSNSRGSTDRAANHLDERYQQLPDGADNMLIAKQDGGTMFRRQATDNELELLRDIDGISLKDSNIVTGSDINGFYVTNFGEHGEGTVTRSETRVIADGMEPFDPWRPLETQLSSDDLSPAITTLNNEWYEHPCFALCTGCGGSIGNCIVCSPTCAGSPTGIGLFACAACLFTVCHGVLVASCAACADCLTDNPL